MYLQLLCWKISSHTGLHPPFLTQERFWRWTRTSNVGSVHRNGRPQPTSGHQTMQCTRGTSPPRRDQTWALDTKIVYVSPQMNRTRNEKSWRNAHHACTIQANEHLKGKNTKARWDKIGFRRLAAFCPFDDVSICFITFGLAQYWKQTNPTNAILHIQLNICCGFLWRSGGISKTPQAISEPSGQGSFLLWSVPFWQWI